MMNNLLTGGIFSLLNNLFNPMMMADGAEGGGGGSESTETGTTAPKVPGWVSGLSVDLQSNEYFTSKNTVSELAKDALLNKTKLESAITIPGENATDDERAAYREKLGVPKTKDDYNFGDLTENEFLGWFKEKAHDLGFTQKQAEIVGSFNKFVTESQTREKEANTKAIESDLRNNWGDAYEARITKAKNFAKKYGGEDFKVDDLSTIKLLDTFAGLVSEDSFGGGLGGQGGATKKTEKGMLPLNKSFPGK